jgi:hypothetical protein
MTVNEMPVDVDHTHLEHADRRRHVPQPSGSQIDQIHAAEQNRCGVGHQDLTAVPCGHHPCGAVDFSPSGETGNGDHMVLVQRIPQQRRAMIPPDQVHIQSHIIAVNVHQHVDTTAVVLRVVDGDTVDIRDDVRGRVRVRLQVRLISQKWDLCPKLVVS